MAIEPCARCAEETSVGSVFYSDRREIDLPDGKRAWLCVLCDGLIRASRRGTPMTDDEVRRLVETGSMAGLAWPGD
ncbi:MAG TPA: hypothetical protein VFO73_03985 [Candidatus Limnocylindrales bacterium]|nr:hypothetical protein [Candidatus Limnocylindrales bacterium]